MTTEAAVAKLMWILGQTRDFDEAEAVLPARGATSSTKTEPSRRLVGADAHIRPA